MPYNYQLIDNYKVIVILTHLQPPFFNFFLKKVFQNVSLIQEMLYIRVMFHVPGTFPEMKNNKANMRLT